MSRRQGVSAASADIAESLHRAFDDAHGKDFPCGILGDGVSDDGVIVLLDDVHQFTPELSEKLIGQVGFKDAFLDADSIEFTGFGDLAQAPVIANVVCNDSHHIFDILIDRVIRDSVGGVVPVWPVDASVIFVSLCRHGIRKKSLSS